MDSRNVSRDRYLGIGLGETEYGIPLLLVREVIGIPPITPVPQTPPEFLGIMNLRGQVIPVVDLRLKAGLPPKREPEVAIVICETSGGFLGFVVDAVHRVITPADATGTIGRDEAISSGAAFVSGVLRDGAEGREKLILLIDLEQVVGAEAVECVRKSATQAA